MLMIFFIRCIYVQTCKIFVLVIRVISYYNIFIDKYDILVPTSLIK